MVIITPIYKKGSYNECNNFRGICRTENPKKQLRWFGPRRKLNMEIKESLEEIVGGETLPLHPS